MLTVQRPWQVAIISIILIVLVGLHTNTFTLRRAVDSLSTAQDKFMLGYNTLDDDWSTLGHDGNETLGISEIQDKSTGPEQEVLATEALSSQPHCANLPGSSDVLLVLKTGATELDAKLPVHIATTLTCTMDHVIFSDLAQSFGQTKIRNALANITQSVQDEDPHFDLYRKIQAAQSEGQDVSTLHAGSWDLDKWKFLPVVSSAFEMLGDKKWIVMVEADTFIFWPNLLRLLGSMDPDEAIYAGSHAYIGDTEFAHGGSGVILSRSAAQIVHESYSQRQGEWDSKLRNECCGDKVLADVLKEADVNLTHAWPMIQGETLRSLDWVDNMWCRPSVSWHHVGAAEINAFWQFDRLHSGESDRPVLFKEIWESDVRPVLRDQKIDWDNLSRDWRNDGEQHEQDEGASNESAEACRVHCERNPECLQWRWEPRLCSGSRVMRLGQASARTAGPVGDNGESAEGEPSVVSGWMMGRIEERIREWDQCQDENIWAVNA